MMLRTTNIKFNSQLPTHISTQTTLQHMAFCVMTKVTISAFILLTENHVTTRQFPTIRCNSKEHITYLKSQSQSRKEHPLFFTYCWPCILV